MYTPSTPCSGNSAVLGGGMSGLRCGMGCASCGGTCNQGMGLFDSGFDLTQWGAVEWAAVGLGLYVAFSVATTTRRGVRAVSEKVKRTRKRVAKRISGQ